MVFIFLFVCFFIILFVFLPEKFIYYKIINQSIILLNSADLQNYEYSLSPSLTRQTQAPNMDLMIPTAQNPRDGIPSRSPGGGTQL